VTRSVALALGSNLGDRVANLGEAMRRLFDGPYLTFVAASSIYETPPWGVTNQPAFANAAVLATTPLGPHALLARVKSVEGVMGRTPAERWGPRLIDIDLIDIAGVALAAPMLTLPHPRLFDRAFVLVPLAEIAPDRIIAGHRVADVARGLIAGPVIAPPWTPGRLPPPAPVPNIVLPTTD